MFSFMLTRFAVRPEKRNILLPLQVANSSLYLCLFMAGPSRTQQRPPPEISKRVTPPDPGDPNTIGNANVIVKITRKDRYGEQDKRKGSYETSAKNFCSPTDCARMSEIY
jgi:hypothetical protein